ncbi:hypothetical protein Tco_1489608 [Tanacetum coccineum]
MPDVDPENYRLCKDPQHLTLESQTLRVYEFNSASKVTKSQIKRVPKVLTFERTKLSPSVFLGQHISDLPLHYKFTFSNNHLMQEHKTKGDENEKEDPLAVDYGIRYLGNGEDNDGEDNDEDDSDKELYVADEVADDNILDELILMFLLQLPMKYRLYLFLNQLLHNL